MKATLVPTRTGSDRSMETAIRKANANVLMMEGRSNATREGVGSEISTPTGVNYADGSSGVEADEKCHVWADDCLDATLDDRHSTRTLPCHRNHANERWLMLIRRFARPALHMLWVLVPPCGCATPQDDERGLERILGRMDIPDDAPAHPEDHGAVPAHDPGERLGIALGHERGQKLAVSAIEAKAAENSPSDRREQAARGNGRHRQDSETLVPSQMYCPRNAWRSERGGK